MIGLDLNPSGVVTSYWASLTILQGTELGVILFETTFGFVHIFSLTKIILASWDWFPSMTICPCWCTSFTLSLRSSRDNFYLIFSFSFSTTLLPKFSTFSSKKSSSFFSFYSFCVGLVYFNLLSPSLNTFDDIFDSEYIMLELFWGSK